jgi:hypothetical protein
VKRALALLFFTNVASADVTDQCLAASEAGQDAKLKGRLVVARGKLAECSAATCPQMVRDDCTKWLAEVDKRLPTLLFYVTTPHGDELRNVEVRSDGSLLVAGLDGRAVAVEPGTHLMRFEAPGRLVHIEKIEIVEGVQLRKVPITLYDESEAPMPAGVKLPSPKAAEPVVLTRVELRTWAPPPSFWILGATGIAAGGVALGTWMASFAEYWAMRGSCAPPPYGHGMGCSQGRVDGVEAMRVVSVTAAIASALSLGAATAVFVLDRNKAVKVGLGSVSFEGSF